MVFFKSLTVIWRWIWLIIILTLAVAGAYIFSQRPTEPIYTTSARLKLVVPGPETLILEDSPTASLNLENLVPAINEVAEVAEDGKVIERTIDQLGTNETYGVQAEAGINANLVVLTFTSNNPVNLQEIAQAHIENTDQALLEDRVEIAQASIAYLDGQITQTLADLEERRSVYNTFKINNNVTLLETEIRIEEELIKNLEIWRTALTVPALNDSAALSSQVREVDTLIRETQYQIQLQEIENLLQERELLIPQGTEIDDLPTDLAEAVLALDVEIQSAQNVLNELEAENLRLELDALVEEQLALSSDAAPDDATAGVRVNSSVVETSLAQLDDLLGQRRQNFARLVALQNEHDILALDVDNAFADYKSLIERRENAELWLVDQENIRFVKIVDPELTIKEVDDLFLEGLIIVIVGAIVVSILLVLLLDFFARLTEESLVETDKVYAAPNITVPTEDTGGFAAIPTPEPAMATGQQKNGSMLRRVSDPPVPQPMVESPLADSSIESAESEVIKNRSDDFFRFSSQRAGEELDASNVSDATTDIAYDEDELDASDEATQRFTPIDPADLRYADSEPFNDSPPPVIESDAEVANWLSRKPEPNFEDTVEEISALFSEELGEDHNSNNNESESLTDERKEPVEQAVEDAAESDLPFFAEPVGVDQALDSPFEEFQSFEPPVPRKPEISEPAEPVIEEASFEATPSQVDQSEPLIEEPPFALGQASIEPTIEEPNFDDLTPTREEPQIEEPLWVSSAELNSGVTPVDDFSNEPSSSDERAVWPEPVFRRPKNRLYSSDEAREKRFSRKKESFRSNEQGKENTSEPAQTDPNPVSESNWTQNRLEDADGIDAVFDTGKFDTDDAWQAELFKESGEDNPPSSEPEKIQNPEISNDGIESSPIEMLLDGFGFEAVDVSADDSLPNTVQSDSQESDSIESLLSEITDIGDEFGDPQPDRTQDHDSAAAISVEEILGADLGISDIDDIPDEFDTFSDSEGDAHESQRDGFLDEKSMLTPQLEEVPVSDEPEIIETYAEPVSVESLLFDELGISSIDQDVAQDSMDEELPTALDSPAINNPEPPQPIFDPIEKIRSTVNSFEPLNPNQLEDEDDDISVEDILFEDAGILSIDEEVDTTPVPETASAEPKVPLVDRDTASFLEELGIDIPNEPKKVYKKPTPEGDEKQPSPSPSPSIEEILFSDAGISDIDKVDSQNTTRILPPSLPAEDPKQPYPPDIEEILSGPPPLKSREPEEEDKGINVFEAAGIFDVVEDESPFPTPTPDSLQNEGQTVRDVPEPSAEQDEWIQKIAKSQTPQSIEEIIFSGSDFESVDEDEAPSNTAQAIPRPESRHNPRPTKPTQNPAQPRSSRPESSDRALDPLDEEAEFLNSFIEFTEQLESEDDSPIKIQRPKNKETDDEDDSVKG